MEFKLTDEQLKKYMNWAGHCRYQAGTIGGKHSFVFTPTGVGTILSVACICGEELELTDVSNW